MIALTNHLWQSTVFAAAAAALALLLRANRAQVRYALWFSASIKFLVPFSLLIGLGRLVPALPPAHRAQPAAVPVVSRVIEPFAPSVPADDPPSATASTDSALVAA